MFNKKLKHFQNHWFEQVNELKSEAEGLMEWLLIQENHKPSPISSGDIEERHNKILAVYDTLESQLPFLLNQSSSEQLLQETKSVIDLLHEASLRDIPREGITNTAKIYAIDISIDDIVKASVLTTVDVNRVLELPYSSFIEQVVTQPLEAKRYAYSALLKRFMEEIQHQRIYNFRYLSEVADVLHNIPGFLVSGFHLFDDDRFWTGVFHRKSDNTIFIIETFLAGLTGYYKVMRQEQNDLISLNTVKRSNIE